MLVCVLLVVCRFRRPCCMRQCQVFTTLVDALRSQRMCLTSAIPSSVSTVFPAASPAALSRCIFCVWFCPSWASSISSLPAELTLYRSVFSQITILASVDCCHQKGFIWNAIMTCDYLHEYVVHFLWGSYLFNAYVTSFSFWLFRVCGGTAAAAPPPFRPGNPFPLWEPFPSHAILV